MFKRTVQTLLVCAACSLITVPVMAQTAPDNTKVNKHDRAKGAPTADQQKENAGDRDLSQKIRQSIMKDKSLSTYAHNVKVIAQDGQVTLKGPVRSDEEKRTIEALANEVAGNGHVTSQITVAPAQDKSRK
jgi:hyperosmotically inducible periplasmic protein